MTRAPVVGLIALLSSCTWIPISDYDARFDLDGDGVDGRFDCDDRDADVAATVRTFLDADGDGFGDPAQPLDRCGVAVPSGASANSDDCDDSDPSVHPDAAEVCNGRDDDCDGATEDDDPSLDPDSAAVWLPDADDDGYTVALTLSEAVRACEAPVGYAAPSVIPDCDDQNATLNPAATEACGDGLDNDCDGATDDQGLGSGGFYLDVDQDGWPDRWTVIEACGDDAGVFMREADAPVDATEADCDPADPLVHPGMVETWYDGVDADCQGDDDFDQDRDGARHPLGGGDDCDDQDAAVAPGAPETWYDGVDADCSGQDDYDQDGDGARHPSGGGDDCDDLDAARFPGAADAWYDGIDSDCAGNNDGDRDRDGSSALIVGGDDCDDDDPTRAPGAPDDWYDGVDSDCAGDDDFDRDGDGSRAVNFGGTDCDDGDPAVRVGAPDAWFDGIDADCAGDDDFDQDGDGERHPLGGGDDCDDTRADVLPGQVDLWYDGLDSDCDGDDDYDRDGDGFRHPLGGGDDCDDTLDDVYPGAPDNWYDGIDHDCANNDDFDLDGDGYRHPLGGGNDCDDTDATVHPGAAEVWYDGRDADCAGDNDDDQDGDGRTVLGAAVGTADDCDDLQRDTFPGAYDLPADGVDQDCDGVDTLACFTDADLDGFGSTLVPVAGATCGALATAPGDCDDTEATTYPGAPELCDAVDQDCDEAADGDVATATLRDGSRAPLGFVADIDGLDVAHVDLCGGVWDLSILWDPADGDLALVAHDDYPRPQLVGARPLLRGDGLGRNTLEISGVDLRVDDPGLTLLSLTSNPLGRAQLVLDDVDVSDVALDVIVEATDADLVLTDVTVARSALGAAIVRAHGGTIQMVGVDVHDNTRTPAPKSDGEALVTGYDVYAEVSASTFLRNRGRAASFIGSAVVAANNLWEDNWLDGGAVGVGDGGALYLDDSELYDEYSTYRRNGATGAGGAVAARNNSELVFESPVFSGNGPSPLGVAPAGLTDVGGTLSVDGDLALFGGLLTRSSAARRGGAIDHSLGVLELQEATQVTSSALLPGNDGGVAIYSDGQRVSFTYDGLITGFDGEDGSTCVEVHSWSYSYLQGMDFTDCQALCVEATGGGSLSFFGNLFDGCEGDGGDGGALRVTDAYQLELYGNTFIDNRSDGNGGAISTNTTSVQSEYNVFQRNTAVGSGGAMYAPDATVEVCGDDTLDNVAGLDGGGYYIGGNAEFGEALFSCATRAIVSGNDAGGRGGGVWGGAKLALRWLDLIGNHAVEGGGAFIEGYLSGSIQSSVADNAADTTGGGIHNQTGGGIHNQTAFASSVLYTVPFTNNRADRGGALYFEGVGWNKSFPPALFGGNLFEANRANAGSAVYMAEMTGTSLFSGAYADSFTGSVVLDRNAGPSTLVREAWRGTWALSVDALSPSQTLSDPGAFCTFAVGVSDLDCTADAPCVCP
jgi:predicted outer membrane repeat protein